MASRSQSTKRNEAPNKIKIQMNGDSAKVIHNDDDSDNDSSDDSSPDSPKVSKLVKGKESNQDDQNKKKKEVPIRIDTSVLENVTCTACGRQLNPYKNSSVQKHPELKVIICKKCDKFLDSGQIAKDKDGIDEQCRWCGEGGRLVVCDHCSCAFCKACVMRNFNRSEFNNINDQESWKCYLCDKSQMQSLLDNYRSVRDTMKALQDKKKRKEQANSAKEASAGNGTGRFGRAPGSFSSSQNSNKKSTQAVKSAGSSHSGGGSSQDVALCVQDLEVDHMHVEGIMDKLSTATNTFKEMLRALRSQFHSTSPRGADEAPPMFNFSLGNSSSIETKRIRCAKAVNRGLVTYFQSLRKILHSEDPHSSKPSSTTSKLLPIPASSAPTETLLIDSSSSSSDEDQTSSKAKKSSRGRLSLNQSTNNKETDSSSKTKSATEAVSLKGKLSVSTLFTKSSKSTSEKKSGFKSCTKVVDKESGEEHVEAETPPSSSPTKDIVIDKEKSANDKNLCSKDKDEDSRTDNAATEKAKDKKTEHDVVDENVAAKLDMIQQLAEELSDSEDEENADEVSDHNDEEQLSDSIKDPNDRAESAGKRKTRTSNGRHNNKRSSPDKETEDEVSSSSTSQSQKNVAAKLDMIQQLAEELSSSEDEENAEEVSDQNDEQLSDSVKDPNNRAESTTKRKMKASVNHDNNKSSSADEDTEDKSSTSQSKNGKKTLSKPKAVHEDKKQKSIGDSSSKKDNSDDDDGGGSSSSDPLDSDDDEDGSSSRKTRKKSGKSADKSDKANAAEKEKQKSKPEEKGKMEKKTQNNKDEKKKDKVEKKESGKAEKKESDKAEKKESGKAEKKESDKAEKKESDKADKKESDKADKKEKDNAVVPATQIRSARIKARKANSTDQQNGKSDSKKKDGKSKAGSDEEDEMDKEIEKLSKLPTLQKKKPQSKKEEKDEEAEKSNEGNAKKGTRQSKRNTKKAVDIDDLSSDGEEEDKSDSEEEDEAHEEIDSDLEPTVSFGQQDEDSTIEKNNLSAKKCLLEEEDDIEDEEEDSNDDEDDDDDMPLKKSKATKTKGKKKENGEKEDEDESGKEEEEEEDGADSDENVGGKKRKIRSKLLDSKLTDSDSDDVGATKKKKKKDDNDNDNQSFEGEDESSSGSSLDSDSDESKDESEDEEDDEDEEGGSKKKGKRKGRKRRKKKSKKGGSNDEDDEEDEEEGKGKKGKKRKRIKKMSDSSDGDEDDKGGPGKRKKIRKVMSNKKLEDTTKAAAKAEEKRRKRIAAKQREFNTETITDENNPMNAPITTKLILEPGKEEGDDPIIQVNKKLIRKLKPHQVDAVQFMWDCLYESVKRSRKEEGAGCILAHCMGLGKTLSVISFVHTVMSHLKALNQRTCLVVCPLNTVFNWRNEWGMWLEKKDRLEVWELASCKQNNGRVDLLREWQESGGIMIIGYEMYRNLTTGARIKNKRHKKAFQETLVDPGPDLCVCDEGHILKNENSTLSKAMNLMKTRRRIVLTGTPLQNNLNEYHCMVTFVKPNLLGTRKEFNNRFISPILNGQCKDSTQRDVRIMKARAHVLHEMLAGCVQRRDYSALTKFLPPKQEYVISVRMTDVQAELYSKYMELTGQGVDGVFTNKGARLFKDYQNLMKIWTHPWVLKLAEIRDELKMKYDDEEDSFIDDDSDDDKSISTSSSSDSEENVISDSGDDEVAPKGPHGKKGTRRTRAKARRQAGEESDPEEVIAEWKSKIRGENVDDIKTEPVDTRVSREWWAQYVTEDDKAKVELSNKLYLLFEILRMCEEIGDKVLIFSQSILSLNIIESFLETIDSKFQNDLDKKLEENPDHEGEESETFGKCWTKNLDYYRMDGSTSAQNRQMWAESFNDMDNYRTRLFLISTKAGGLGINLVAANRVIIFDASWNPSHDVQSIFRVYRFGQTKPCYIYRFLAQGTMEEKIYERQVTKLSLSQRVVDEHQIESHFSANDLRELYNFKPEKWVEDGEHATLDLPKDPLLAEILKTHRKCVVSFHEHDSLLENQIEQTLSEEEKKAAWEEYENEKKGIIVRGPGMESMRGASWPMMAAAQILSKEQIAATVHALRQQLPDLPEDVFHMHVQQALRRQVQMKQDEMRRMEMMRMQELTYLNMMQQQQQQQEMGGMGAMQNMAPWMQIQHLRAMQNHMMRGNRNYGMGMSSSSSLSNRPDEAINLDESPAK